MSVELKLLSSGSDSSLSLDLRSQGCQKQGSSRFFHVIISS